MANGFNTREIDAVAEEQRRQQQRASIQDRTTQERTLPGGLNAAAANVDAIPVVTGAPAADAPLWQQAPEAGPAATPAWQQAPTARPVQPAQPAQPTPEQVQQVLQQRQQEIIQSFPNAPPEERETMARELGHIAGVSQQGAVGAAVMSAGEGLFGLGSRTGAFFDWLFADDDRFKYAEFLEYRRGQAEGAREANPVAGTLGYLFGIGVGVVGPGGLAARGAGALAPGAARVLTPAAGQTAANIGRYAAAGATAGGAQAVGEGGIEDLLAGALTGAVVGPLARGAVVAGGRALGRVASAGPVSRAVSTVTGGRVVPADIAAMRRVASTIRRPDETLAQAAARVRAAATDFQRVHGRSPAANEIVDAIDDPALRRTAQMTETGERRAGELTQRQLREAPETLARRGETGVVRGRVSTPAATVASRQRTEMDRFMAREGDSPITAISDENSMWQDPTFARYAIARGHDPSSRALRDLAENDQTATITLRTLDDARLRIAGALSKMSRSDPNYQLLRGFREELRQLGEEAVDGYGEALTRFGVRGDIMTGIEIGQQVAAQADAAVTAAAVQAANPAARLGMRLGARSAVRGLLGRDPGGAAGAVRRISEDHGLQRRLAAMLGDDEARAMVEAADIAHRAFRARVAATPAGQAGRDNVASMVKTALEAGALTTRRGSAGFMVNVIRNLMDKLTMSRAARRRVVDMAYDPEKFVQVLSWLERQGVTPAQFSAAINQAAAAGAIAGPRSEEAAMAGTLAGIGAVQVVGGAVRGLGGIVGLGGTQQ